MKNGRISKVAGLLSGMLSLRPIMGDDGHGSIAAIEKVRGTQNARRRLVAVSYTHLDVYKRQEWYL